MGLVGGFWFYSAVVKDLPDVSNIDNITLAQSTNITDKNGEVLYKVFQENRQYVDYDKISPRMVQAIVSVENSTYRTDPGVDFLRLARALFNQLLGNSDFGGGSTITQQLVKNLLLTPEKSVVRKAKEIVLALQMNDIVRQKVQQDPANKNLSATDLDRKVKEKILELYLNYIFLGNNSYGVEAAAYTYFGTSAQNLDIVQSAILASLPQAPSYYNPYSNNRDALMGALNVTQDGDAVTATGDLYQAIVNKVSDNISKVNLDSKKANQEFLDFLKGVTSFDITYNGQNYSVVYTPGRKDFSLTRMFEENYITQDELKSAFVEGLNIKFEKSRVEIKAPHFVFWVLDLLKSDPRFTGLINADDLDKG